MQLIRIETFHINRQVALLTSLSRRFCMQITTQVIIIYSQTALADFFSSTSCCCSTLPLVFNHFQFPAISFLLSLSTLNLILIILAITKITILSHLADCFHIICMITCNFHRKLITCGLQDHKLTRQISCHNSALKAFCNLSLETIHFLLILL